MFEVTIVIDSFIKIDHSNCSASWIFIHDEKQLHYLIM